MIQPGLAEVVHLARDGNVIPIHKEILADLLTPASAFLRVAQGRSRVFLLESVEGGERLARYSFIGWDPFLVLRGKGNSVTIEEQGEVAREAANPYQKLREVARNFRPVAIPGLPPFVGGGVGYFAYDLARHFEALPSTTNDDLQLDDLQVMYFSTILAFDHLRHRIHIIANLITDRGPQSLESKYGDAARRLEQIEKRLSDPLSLPVSLPRAGGNTPLSSPGEDSFCIGVAAAKRHIEAGDIFQAVLSRRLSVKIDCDPFDIYRALRCINPSPYMFFIRMNGLHLVGASPEMLVKVCGRSVEYGPIAGTRPRGATPEEDERLTQELLNDPKERAEHAMLVDLGRNDLGRVCEFGSVRAKDLMRVEKYSHVMHLVSGLEGRLREGLDALHALEACFPAGTVSGAPKVRAMEIIEALESSRRGVYGGAIGYLDFSGNLDTCIGLRTIVIKEGQAHIQVGAGIVADSEDVRELEETTNKAGALLGAVRLAERGLGLS